MLHRGCRVAISLRRLGRQPEKTLIKIRARCNGPIKSYEPVEAVLWSGWWSDGQDVVNFA